MYWLYRTYLKKRHVEESNLPQHGRLYDVTMCYTQYTEGKVIGAELFPVVPGLVLSQEGLRSGEPPPSPPPSWLLYTVHHIFLSIFSLFSLFLQEERGPSLICPLQRERKKPVRILGLVWTKSVVPLVSLCSTCQREKV